MQAPAPTELRYRQERCELTIAWEREQYVLGAEFLRVHSPSAEVRGHGPGQEVLQTGKEDVNIVAIEPVGQYAIRLVFSDEHDTGLYSWDYLYDIGINQEPLWNSYLERLAAAGITRKETS